MKRTSILFIVVTLMSLSVIFTQGQLFSFEYKYESGDRRDPFIPLIISQRRMSVGLEAVESIEDVKFEGVIFDPAGKSMAVLNGEIVKEGEKVHNVKIVKIYENAVTLKIFERVHTINLVEKGGEAVER